MGIVDETLKILDRIPIWKRLQEAPTEIDELKARIAALEDKLNGKWPADVCTACGERALRRRDQRANQETWVCKACGKLDTRRTC